MLQNGLTSQERDEIYDADKCVVLFYVDTQTHGHTEGDSCLYVANDYYYCQYTVSLLSLKLIVCRKKETLQVVSSYILFIYNVLCIDTNIECKNGGWNVYKLSICNTRRTGICVFLTYLSCAFVEKLEAHFCRDNENYLSLQKPSRPFKPNRC